jgi:carbon storage regulator CsrA
MLVLSRKEGERLLIGDNIVVTINRISGNRVTLGIEAPRTVRIVRGELEVREPEGIRPSSTLTPVAASSGFISQAAAPAYQRSIG